MKTLLLMITGLLMGSTNQVDPVSDTEIVPTDCVVQNNVFQPGEKFGLLVYYHWSAFWLKAGEVTFTTQQEKRNNRDVYHLRAFGETYKSYEWFYKVRDVYESWVDKSTMQPYQFNRDIKEGSYSTIEEYHFNKDKQQVQRIKKKYTPPRVSEHEIPNCVYDVVSAIYYARCLDYDRLKPNEKVPVPIFIDDDLYEVYIRYIGKKTIKTKTGTFKCHVVKPLMLNNEYFDGGENMTVYVSDDLNKLPIRIEADLSVGEIIADLKYFSGIKHPFTAGL